MSGLKIQALLMPGAGGQQIALALIAQGQIGQITSVFLPIAEAKGLHAQLGRMIRLAASGEASRDDILDAVEGS